MSGCCGQTTGSLARAVVDPNVKKVTVYLAKDVDLKRYVYCTTTQRWKDRKNLGYKSAGQLTITFTKNDVGVWNITSPVPSDLDLTGLPCLEL